MSPSILILDYYIDEPACFGVPPFLSPHVRYAAGALVRAGYAPEQIHYLTVDRLRSRRFDLDACRAVSEWWTGPVPEDIGAIFLISGVTVPGRYLGGKIGTLAEILKFLEKEKKHKRPVFIGGPVKYCSLEQKKAIAAAGGLLLNAELDTFINAAFPGPDTGPGRASDFDASQWQERYKPDYQEIGQNALAGAFISRRHPNFPFLINEMETYRGCTRNTYCSFCTEALYGRPRFRPTEDLLAEFAALGREGNRYFRIGRQADIFTYQADLSVYRDSYPLPRPEELKKLYAGIHAAVPDLKLLHLDNVNPGGLVNFEPQSRAISQIISDHNTWGDTAAMGFESVDPTVIEKNQLKISTDAGLRALEIINADGARRDEKTGVPKLLPGLNFIHGLPGETEATFALNYEFLERAREEGFLIRRINLRQLVRYEKAKVTKMKGGGRPKKENRLKRKFQYYRDLIRKNIDFPMLQKIFPVGTRLPEVIIEQHQQGYSLGRPLGSYPITVKFPMELPLGKPVEAVIINHRERTVLGLPAPVDWENLSVPALRLLPGVTARKATDIRQASHRENTPVAVLLGRELAGRFPQLFISGEDSQGGQSATVKSADKLPR